MEKAIALLRQAQIESRYDLIDRAVEILEKFLEKAEKATDIPAPAPAPVEPKRTKRK